MAAADGSFEYSGGWKDEQRHGYGVLFQVGAAAGTAAGTAGCQQCRVPARRRGMPARQLQLLLALPDSCCLCWQWRQCFTLRQRASLTLLLDSAHSVEHSSTWGSGRQICSMGRASACMQTARRMTASGRRGRGGWADRPSSTGTKSWLQGWAVDERACWQLHARPADADAADAARRCECALRHGQGKLSLGNYRYEGGWKEDRPHGVAVCQTEAGDRYKGGRGRPVMGCDCKSL